MKRTILIAAAIISISSHSAMADLQVYGTDSEIGSKCYSDNKSGDTTRLYKINDPSGRLVNNITEYDMDECPTSYSIWDISPEGECWVNYTNDALYVCAKGSDSKTCRYASPWTEYFFNNEWETIDENRVMLIDGEKSKSIGDYTCIITPIIEYGCAAGYYTTAASPSATMTCTRCPASGGIYGTSEIGNTSITGCYIPSNTSYNDGTGNVTLSGDCYYTK